MKSSRFLLALVLALFTALAGRAQQNWSFANTLPAANALKSVAYGNGLYVAVGTDATIVSSPDAVTWTVRRMSTGGMHLNSVAFADGRFVAVGMGTPTSIGGALVMTSPDGVAWTVNDTVASTYSAQLQGVVYGNGTWVISGASQNRVLTSTDGLTWTARNAGANTNRVVYGAGKFAAMTAFGDRVITSTDGITWTSSTLAVSGGWIESIGFGGGKFVAVGRTSNFSPLTFNSTDGVAWTAGTAIAGSSVGFDRVAFANNVFVASGNNLLYSSPDGVTWTSRTSAMPPASSGSPGASQTEFVGEVSSANNLLFALGFVGAITTSTDGIAWTRRSSGTAHSLYGVVHDGTRFVAVGTGGTVVTSTDGTTWTSVTTDRTGWFGRIAFGNGRYVTAGLSGGFSSANLTAWSTVPGTVNNQSFGAIFANGRFVVANTALSLGLPTSTDGVTWTTASASTTAGQSVQGLAGGGGSFVVTTGGFGGSPKIFSSTDALTWTDRTPAAFTTPDSLAYANGRYVLLTSSHTWTSTDGVTWTSTAQPSASYVTRVAAAGSRFIARGSSFYTTYRTSTDGVTWTDIENGTAPNLNFEGVAVSGSVAVAVGSGGMILRGNVIGAAPPQPQTLSATVAAGATVQWQRNGNTVSGATSANLSLADVQPADAGVYSAVITSGGTTSLQSFIVGVSSAAKVMGNGSEVGPNIPHANGSTYDQLLLEGVAATFTADSSLNQITRLSFVDLSNDIVQVEYSGPGSVSIVLDGSSGPATAVNYNQSTVSYMKGHAAIVVTGANENSNLTVFSVGRGNAVNQGLFKSVTYDGFADLAFVAISTTNGKFGGLRTANVSYFATKGLTGVYAPGVQFTGPVYLGDISASDNAIPAIIVGSGTTTQINGGDLLQANNRAIQVATLTPWTFVGGSTSHHTTADPHLLAAQNNRARFEQNGTDVTSQVVVNPPASSTPAAGKQLTYFAAGSNPPFANGAKKTFTATTTTLQFDSTTLTNPTTLPASGTVTGFAFTDAATGLVWEVYFLNGAFHEINVMRNGQFVGQWS